MEVMIVWAGLFMAGWLAGSLINLLADQMPNDHHPFSDARCLNCQQQIRWLNYLGFRMCANCRAKRSIRTWLVQISSPLIVLLLWNYPHHSLPFWAGFLLLMYFYLISIIDLEHKLVLGLLSMAGVAIGGTAGTLMHGWLDTLLGGGAGFLAMFGIYWLGRAFSAWLARRSPQPVEKEALGFGDVHIGLIIGLVLGWPGVSAGILLGIILGGVLSGIYMLLMLILKRYQFLTAVPYAPFLIGATVLLIFLPKGS